MKKVKILLIFIFIGFIVCIGLIYYDKIIGYIGLPTKGLEYTLNDEGTSYSVSKGKMKKTEKLIIPSTYNEIPVTSIKESAFKDCNSIIAVIIPDTITSIGSEAFLGCTNLKEIIIPNSVLEIGNGAFFGCSSLTLYSSPFSGSGKDGENYIGFVFGAKLSLDNGAFVPKSLETIRITSDNKTIELYAFAFLPNLKEIFIIETHKNINPFILHKCDNIERISIPLVIPCVLYLFDGPTPNSLKYFDLSSSGDGVLFGTFFKDCKGLININIPEGIEYIDYHAFDGCTGLTYIYIPKSVIYMGQNIFINCPNLEINCEVVSKPVAWDDSWNHDNRPVIWGSTSN